MDLDSRYRVLYDESAPSWVDSRQIRQKREKLLEEAYQMIDDRWSEAEPVTVGRPSRNVPELDAILCSDVKPITIPLQATYCGTGSRIVGMLAICQPKQDVGVHQASQVENYWSTETVAGAVVMITDAELPDWVDVYRRKCLESFHVRAETDGVSPLRAVLRVASRTSEGVSVEVDHFLLRLRRGR